MLNHTAFTDDLGLRRTAVFRPRFPLRFLAGLLGVLGLTLGLMSAGCASQPTEQVVRPKLHKVSGNPNVFALDDLGGKLTSDQATVRHKTDVTPMSLSVPIDVKSDRTRQAQYRFVFYDDHGTALEPKMDWQWKVLPARTSVFFRGQAPTEDAANWRLYIRPDQSASGQPGQPGQARQSRPARSSSKR